MRNLIALSLLSLAGAVATVWLIVPGRADTQDMITGDQLGQYVANRVVLAASPSTPSSPQPQVGSPGAQRTDSVVIIQCDVNLDDAPDSYQQQVERVLQGYQHATQAEHLLAYAMFSQTTQTLNQMNRLVDFIARFPANTLALRRLLTLCSSEISHPVCTDELLDSVVESEAQNAAAWLAVANYYAVKNHLPAAKNALYALLTAPVLHEDYASIVSLYVDALAGSEAEQFGINALAGLAHAAANLASTADVTALCLDAASVDDEMLNLCLSVGENLENRAMLMKTKLFGNSLQGLIYGVQGDHDAAARVAARASSILLSPDNQRFDQALLLALHDQRLFRGWLNNIDEFGEQAAAQMLLDEAILLSQNPFYRPCL